MNSPISTEQKIQVAQFFALMGGAMCGFSEIVAEMLNKGVPVNVTATQIAGIDNLETDTSVSQRIARTDTPLLVAVRHTVDEKTIQVLLEWGADVTATDEQGLTPLMIAAANGHTNIVRLLQAAGAVQ